MLDLMPLTITWKGLWAEADGSTLRAEEIMGGLAACGWRLNQGFGWERPSASGCAYFLWADGSDPGGPLPQW